MSQQLPLNNDLKKSIAAWRKRASPRELMRMYELIMGKPMFPHRPAADTNRPQAATPHESLAEWCPHEPWPRQRMFLELDCLEAFYGGAAAGGKSDALLMAALQYVYAPGYAALILRRDTQRLRLAGGLIPRSHEWLAGKGARWRESDCCWTFPTGGHPATLRFGYLLDAGDKYRYQSSEFQYIAFDELTEFPEDDYRFLFSRLRRNREVAAPLRMRSASNPGNLGHDWVRRRFIPDALETIDAEAGVRWKDSAAFVPAQVRDNPAVDAGEYFRSLSHLPPVVRQRLMHGDWSIREEGLIHSGWLRYYSQSGERITLQDRRGEPFAEYDAREAGRIATIDPAGTSQQRADEQRGKPPSWSVIEIWDMPPGPLAKFHVLRHVWRERVGFDGLCRAIRQMHAAWQPAAMHIENEKLGQAAVDLLGRELPLRTVATGGRDKVARAAPLIHALERGEVFLPREESTWRCQFEAELLGWTGLADETTDQIDAAAYAIGLDRGGGVLRIGPIF